MTRSKTVDFLNGPLPADQQSYDDAREMIRAMFAVCDLTAEHWELPKTDSRGSTPDLESDTRWLREYFLRSVEFALDSGAEPDTLFDDFCEDINGMEFGGEQDKWCRIETRFDGRSADGDYAFSVTCNDASETAVWLESSAMADRDGVLATINEARQAIHYSIA